MTVPETVPNPIDCRTGDVLGYARVSTCGQDAAGQHDRLGRSLKELLETVEDLKSRGIRLASLEERIDTSEARSWYVSLVMSADFESVHHAVVTLKATTSGGRSKGTSQTARPCTIVVLD